MEYDNRHKKIVQALFGGSMDDEALKALCIEIFNNESVEDIVSEINKYISEVLPHISICSTQCEVTGQKYWVYNSTHLGSKEIYEVYKSSSPNWTEGKISYIKNILHAIITSQEACSSSTHCLNLSSLPDVKLNKTKAEEILNTLVKENWLSYQDGKYYIGPKSAVTLQPYFKENYESYLRTCCLCHQSIFYGRTCEYCPTAVHLYCLQHFASINSSPLKCPDCGKNFIMDKAS